MWRCLYALRVLLSANGLNSFDSAFFSRCASICLITPARPDSLFDTTVLRLGYDVQGCTNAAGAWMWRSGAPAVRRSGER